MGILTVIKNALVIAFLVVGVYLIANFAGPVKNEVMGMLNMPGSSVKGASTKKAEEVTQTISDNLNEQLLQLQYQVLNVSIGDAVNTVSRFQKVPQDAQHISEYAQEQLHNMLQSREQKQKAKERKKEISK